MIIVKKIFYNELKHSGKQTLKQSINQLNKQEKNSKQC